ncbi:MAG: TIGR04255 family protein [Proteobacteria bacterium]|nr:TIGR04255 family protein [Pseudomonadota bacterium]MBU4582963.1 TIGR04255 family protein [Pseudomonadota bacterium]
MIPKKLRKEPLIEAVCELRFKSDKDSISDLLPGLIFQKLDKRFPNVQKLPASALPPVVLKNDPNLRYIPTIKLTGEEPISIMIGEHVFSLSATRPYVGWEKFLSTINELLVILKQTSLITFPERISLKYIDILLAEEGLTLDALNLELHIGGNRITTEPVHLRTELNAGEFTNVIQISSPAQVPLDKGPILKGIVVDIDTISLTMPTDFWSNQEDFLNRAHVVSKSMFFNLLKTETITFLEPEY